MSDQNRSAPITRRQALAVLSSAGALAFLAPSLLLAQGEEKIADIRKTGAEDGDKEFHTVTMTETGGEIEAIAKPGQLTFHIKGPIRIDSPIPVLVIPRSAPVSKGQQGKEPTAEPKSKEQQLKEAAAERLLVISGSFAKPSNVELRRGATHTKVIVPFMFLGKEDASRKIELNVSLIDEEGNVIARDVSLQEDNRIYFRKTGGKEQRGTLWVTISPLNQAVALYKGISADAVHGMKIVFTEKPPSV